MNEKLKIIFRAGLIAGLLDIIAAIVVYVLLLGLTSVKKILQTIASGAFGKNAYSGGWATAFAGLAFHFLIAIIFAGFYLLIYPYWKRFFGNPVIAGLCYGLVVWSIMNFIVLPVATGSMGNFDLKMISISIALIVLCIGIPISIITDKQITRNNS